MPNAFNNSGLVFGSVMTVIVGFLCTHCVWILVSTFLSLYYIERNNSVHDSEVFHIAQAVTSNDNADRLKSRSTERIREYREHMFIDVICLSMSSESDGLSL